MTNEEAYKRTLLNLGSDEMTTVFAKFFIESMKDCSIEMWHDMVNSSAGENIPVPDVVDIRAQAEDYATDLMNDVRNDIIKKIKEMKIELQLKREVSLKTVKFKVG